jgi:acetyltransferase-like isoleucine patch superfamily enzyme
MEIGKYSYGKPQLLWENQEAKLIIKKFCSIANNVKVYLGNGFGHDVSFVSTYPFSFIHQDTFPNVVNQSCNTKGNVVIGNDVWIGENVIIMSGVTIGDGAVIANNSHVVKNVEPYTLNGGNPCQFIKYRFSRHQIEALLTIQWWDWSDEKIHFHLPWICSPDIDGFLHAVDQQTFEHHNRNPSIILVNVLRVYSWIRHQLGKLIL